MHFKKAGLVKTKKGPVQLNGKWWILKMYSNCITNLHAILKHLKKTVFPEMWEGMRKKTRFETCVPTSAFPRHKCF